MDIQKLVDQINLLKGYISGLEWVIQQAKAEDEKKKEEPLKEGT